MKKNLFSIVSFVLILIIALNFVSAVSGETITIDIANGRGGGFLFGEKHPTEFCCDPEGKPFISDMQNQYGVYNTSVISDEIEFSLYLIDYLGNETYFEERYTIEKGKKILIDNPLIDFKEIKCINIKLEEVREHVGYTPEEGDKFEMVPKYVATLQFSESETEDKELTKEPTRCIGTTCYLSIDDILIANINGEEYSFNIRDIWPKDDGVRLKINDKSMKLGEGDFYNLEQYGLSIEISVKDTFENYIVFEVKEEFDSYEVTTPESFFAKIANFFKRLFGKG